MSPNDLRARRLALGYSVNLMAEILRVRVETLLDWEAGRAPIDDAELLGAALNELVTFHRSAPPVDVSVMVDAY
jgi:transcriptional regulator with XRE-family HTH domain